MGDNQPSSFFQSSIEVPLGGWVERGAAGCRGAGRALPERRSRPATEKVTGVSRLLERLRPHSESADHYAGTMKAFGYEGRVVTTREDEACC